MIVYLVFWHLLQVRKKLINESRVFTELQAAKVKAENDRVTRETEETFFEVEAKVEAAKKAEQERLRVLKEEEDMA